MNDKKLICLCGSAGSLETIIYLISNLPKNYPIPIVILVHSKETEKSYLEKILSKETNISIKSPEDNDSIENGIIYIAPPMYHLQIEKTYTFSYSMDPPINFSRPSIDVLLETASSVYKKRLYTIILSGASKDGSYGSKQIEKKGGTVLVLNPKLADFDIMPREIIKALNKPIILNNDGILKFLTKLGGETNGQK